MKPSTICVLALILIISMLIIPPLSKAKMFVEAGCDHPMDTGIPAGTIDPNGYIANNQVYRCKTVEEKLQELCDENRDAPCNDLKDYCREALEKGQECYVIFNK